MGVCPTKWLGTQDVCNSLLDQNTNLATLAAIASDNCYYSLTCDTAYNTTGW